MNPSTIISPSRENLDNRGHFSEGESIGRFYRLDFGDNPGEWLIFNYAVLASFDWPVGDAPYVLDDFPIETANTPEPFHAKVEVIENTLNFVEGSAIGDGELTVDVEVFDWQGADDSVVTIASVDGTSIAETPATSSHPGNTHCSTIFSFVDIPGSPASEGHARPYNMRGRSGRDHR